MEESEKVASEVPEEEPVLDQQAEEPGLVLAGETLPTSLPIMPIRPRPFFPGLHIPLEVAEDDLPVVKLALESATATLGMVLVKDLQGQNSPENLHGFGVAGKILKAVTEEPGTTHILISCLERFSIKELQETPKGLFARVEYHYATQLSSNQELKAYSMAIISALKDLIANMEDTRLPYNELVYGVANLEGSQSIAFPMAFLDQQEGLLRYEFAGEFYLLKKVGDFGVAAYRLQKDQEAREFHQISESPFRIGDDQEGVWDEFGRAVNEGGDDLLVTDGYFTEWYEWVSGWPESQIADKAGLCIGYRHEAPKAPS